MRWAVAQRGARTIVFAVSGTIDLKSPLVINYPNITIAGQTAPGGGICLKGAPLEIAASDVVVRYLRVRLGDAAPVQDKGALAITKGKNIIIDHCSVSWGKNGVLSAFSTHPDLNHVTVQWCFITEGLSPEGQGAASLIQGTGGAKFSFLYNLYANNRGQSLKVGREKDENTHEKDPEGLLLDFRNNVIYNWGGEYTGYNGNKESVTHLNYVNNYLVPGGNSTVSGFAYVVGSPYNKSFFAGNYYNGKIPYDQWGIVKFEDWSREEITAYKQTQPFETGPVKTEDAIIAYSRVLAKAGAILPKRDAVDSRIVRGIKMQIGDIIKGQDQVGGWPELKSRPAPIDTDLDGMPDAWELKNGLNPKDSKDRNTLTDGGYTMLETYLNSM